MLKEIAKRIEKEIKQAFDYMEQAYLVKEKNQGLSELFASLSEEELSHAERLIREGKKIHSENADTIWEWVTRLAMEQISECRYKLSKRG